MKLSGNVDIEGENAGSNNVTDYIGDLALEYKMTEDGRFRVTGFKIIFIFNRVPGNLGVVRFLLYISG